ncbi:MAG: peptide chain release factor 1 [Planctomycetota bacterium]
MLNKLKEISDRYQELERLISDPAVITNQRRYAELMKERGRLSKIALRTEELNRVRRQKSETETILNEAGTDQEFVKMAREELAGLQGKEVQLLNELEEMLLTDTAENQRNVIIEIRAGTGGNEAALFASDIFKMYLKYAEKKGWKVSLMDSSPTNLGGFKEIIFSVEGDDVYKYLRFESGGHRVQRVPDTEASGRIHTSACTVAVLAEPEEIELEIKPEDLEITACRSSGPGGQHVNKTSSAIRIVHKPSGLAVECQTERSQIRNRELAMKLLRTRLYEQMASETKKERDQARKTQIGSGDRSEKIRTYNFPQNRVTDHRINFSVHNLANILAGQIDEIIGPLLKADKEIKLKNLSLVKSGSKSV